MSIAHSASFFAFATSDDDGMIPTTAPTQDLTLSIVVCWSCNKSQEALPSYLILEEVGVYLQQVIVTRP